MSFHWFVYQEESNTEGNYREIPSGIPDPGRSSVAAGGKEKTWKCVYAFWWKDNPVFPIEFCGIL